ncbi:hypothetical protein Bca4012_023317 [Brassica carinata]
MSSYTRIISLLFFSSFLAVCAQNHTYVYHDCPNTTTYARNSTYSTNLRTILSSLSSPNASYTTGFQTAASGQAPDRVTGLFLCRGDLSPEVCRSCVVFSVNDSLTRCPNEREAVLYYDECMLRYSHRTILSTLSRNGEAVFRNDTTIPSNQSERFGNVLMSTLSQAVADAVTSPRKFDARKAEYTAARNVYLLVQCTPDLTNQDCSTCLQVSINQLPLDKVGGRFILPSCNSRFETYPFYNQTAVKALSPPPVSAPERPGKSGKSNGSVVAIVVSTIVVVLLLLAGYCFFTKRKKEAYDTAPASDVCAQNHTYVYHDCPNTTTYSSNSTYSTNLRTLLSSLSSPNASYPTGFQNASSGQAPDRVTGLFLCRGDLSPEVCRSCVAFSVNDSLGRCPNEREAVLYYDECMLRYSNRHILSTLTRSGETDTRKEQRIPSNILERFGNVLLSTLNQAVTDAVKSSRKFDARKANVTESMTVYGLVQCTPDMTRQDCMTCLQISINQLPIDRVGGSFILPNCNSRFETYPFYNETSIRSPQPPPVSAPRRPGKCGKSNVSVVPVVVSTIVVVLLLIAGYCFLTKRKEKKAYDTAPASDVDEISSADSLQLDYITIQAATNDFSESNNIGGGGFGEAWRLWRNEKPLDLIAPVIRHNFQMNKVIRCIHIGLLCVQEDPVNRPTLSTIVMMLSSNTVTIPVPKQPKFFAQSRPKKDLTDSEQSTRSNSVPWSIDDASITELCPR